MNPLGSFTGEALLEQGKSFVKKTGDVTAQGVKVTAQTAAAQLTGNFGMISDAAANIAHGDASSQTAPVHDDQFVRELYGAEHNQSSQSDPHQQQASSQPQPEPHQPQAIDVELQHKLAATRHQLDVLIKQQHMDSYFNPTFNRKPHQEESVVEKNEREEQEKKFEDFEKQKKKPDFALQRAKTRTEMSPGASG